MYRNAFTILSDYHLIKFSMNRLLILAAPLAALLLPGCIAKTALDVVTLPVKVVSSGVDAATTSQSESDEKRGREMRKREERIGKLSRERDKLARKCAEGNRSACRDLDDIERELDDLYDGARY